MHSKKKPCNDWNCTLYNLIQTSAWGCGSLFPLWLTYTSVLQGLPGPPGEKGETGDVGPLVSFKNWQYKSKWFLSHLFYHNEIVNEDKSMSFFMFPGSSRTSRTSWPRWTQRCWCESLNFLFLKYQTNMYSVNDTTVSFCLLPNFATFTVCIAC